VISKERVRELINLGNENRNLDYKGAFSWNEATNDEKCEITKDVLAFANCRDGGVILIGVNDESGALEGLTEDQSTSFDQTKFNSFIQKYTDPRHTANVHRIEIDEKRVVVIDVPEFSELPILCARDANSSVNNRKLILKKAALYKRTDRATSEVIEDAQEMRELLNRGLLRRQDELLRAFKQIIQPGEANRPTEPAAEYKSEIQESENYFSGIAELSSGSTYWTVEMRPESYIPVRIQSAAQIQSLVEQSAISIRGWTFPIAGRVENAKWVNFDGGSQAVLKSEWRGPEALRVYRSGLVVWRSTPKEDRSAYAGQNVTSFISLIFATTEWLLFAKRFFESLLTVEESVHLTIGASGILGRKLIRTDDGGPFPPIYKTDVPKFEIKRIATVSDLRADPEAIARKIVRQIFEFYNWNDPDESMLVYFQERLIQRQF
jgi:hypothetical protein